MSLIDIQLFDFIAIAVILMIISRALKYPLNCLFRKWDEYWTKQLAKMLGITDLEP